MTELNASIRDITISRRMRRLPVSPRGFPVPWFVAWLGGVPDFRCIGLGKLVKAIHQRCCWLCGEPLGVWQTYAIGPMCIVNRVTSEPPSHLDCAEYAARACLFLTKPGMRRNEKDLPEERGVAGVMIPRNPGVVALWITRSSKPFNVSNGVLFDLGEPERILWYCEGRTATRAEVEASVASGLPLLEAEADKDGPDAIKELSQCIARAQALLPA